MYQTSQCGGCGYASNQSFQPQAFYSASAPQQQYHTPQPVMSSSPQIYSNASANISYSKVQDDYISFTPKAEYNFQPNNFIKVGKEGGFVGEAKEIEEHLESAFEKMFDQPFPKDIKVSILEENKFNKLTKSPGVIGLSINRSAQGLVSEIFVKNDYLARVMLTIGHELGHVLTETLDNAHDEEAKAYAFSLAWMKTIKEHNIAGLEEAIVLENPANNGLHNVAFSYVHKLLQKGRKSWEVYLDLIKRVISCKKDLNLFSY